MESINIFTLITSIVNFFINISRGISQFLTYEIKILDFKFNFLTISASVLVALLVALLVKKLVPLA